MVPGERKLGTPVNLLLVPLGHGKNSCLSCIPVICEWVPCHSVSVSIVKPYLASQALQRLHPRPSQACFHLLHKH